MRLDEPSRDGRVITALDWEREERMVEEPTWRGTAVRAGLVAEARRPRYRTLAQFSTWRPGTRLNSRSLLVTSETFALSA
jgi:hypothetical protein